MAKRSRQQARVPLLTLPPKKKAKRAFYDVTIEQLPEALLAKIFSYLPLKQRCQIHTVSKQWLSVSRIPWTDVTYLNSSSIPQEKIKAILDRCPKIKHFVACCGRDIQLEENQKLLGSQLRSLRLYDVEFSLRRDRGTHEDKDTLERLVAVFFVRLPSLEELVWQYVLHLWRAEEIVAFNAMMVSLRRLKLVNARSYMVEPADIISSLGEMVNLECLHLEGIIILGIVPLMMTLNQVLQIFWDALAQLSNLRELCIAEVNLCHAQGGGPIPLKKLADLACERLPQLEVLIYADHRSIEPEGVARLVTSHPFLRILVLSGEDRLLNQPERAPFIVSPRILGPTSTADIAPPLLQVFVGGHIIRKLRFALPEANATRFWLIECVMPKFLAKPEVAQVFEGVWLARMIREAAEVGSQEWVWGGSCGADVFYTQTRPRDGLLSRLGLWSRCDSCWPLPVYRYDWRETALRVATLATIGYVAYKGFAQQK